MATMHEAVKGMEGTIIMEEVTIRINPMIEVEVGHLRDKVEIGGMTEGRATVDLDQVQG